MLDATHTVSYTKLKSERGFDEALPRLIDIANENVPVYKRHLDKRSDVEKSKVNELSASIIPSINMGIDALFNTLRTHYKNRFELCAEEEKLTLDELKNMPLEQQIALLCAKMTPQNHVYGIRRVDFSNRYEEGFQLHYLSLNMNVSSGNSKYGKYCVNIDLPSSDADIALKHDSIVHYYNEKNEFDEEACHGDLIPRIRIELLISDKFSDQVASLSVEDIKRVIESDPDPIEIMTTTVINGDKITAVALSSDDYDYIMLQLNIKKASGESLSYKEEEDLQNFIRLQRELSRRGIRLKRVAKE